MAARPRGGQPASAGVTRGSARHEPAFSASRCWHPGARTPNPCPRRGQAPRRAGPSAARPMHAPAPSPRARFLPSRCPLQRSWRPWMRRRPPASCPASELARTARLGRVGVLRPSHRRSARAGTAASRPPGGARQALVARAFRGGDGRGLAFVQSMASRCFAMNARRRRRMTFVAFAKLSAPCDTASAARHPCALAHEPSSPGVIGDCGILARSDPVGALCSSEFRSDAPPHAR